MRKKEIMQHWGALEPNQPLHPCPVQYKHEGSTYHCDGVRITGSRAWIDAVLSRLKDLLEFENTQTRLQLSYQEATDKEARLPMGTYYCYVQIHQRGGEAQMVNAYASALCGREVIASRRW